MVWTEFRHIFTLSGKIPEELNTDLQLNCLHSYRAPRITKLSLDQQRRESQQSRRWSKIIIRISLTMWCRLHGALQEQ